MRLEALERNPSPSVRLPRSIARPPWSRLQRLAANPDDNFVFGAFDQGQLVGTAGFFRYPLAKARHKGRIWGVYVRESCRRRGIGRALLVALLERIKACPGVG